MAKKVSAPLETTGGGLPGTAGIIETKLDPELHTEIEGLQRAIGRIIVKDEADPEVIEIDPARVDRAVDSLALVRALVRNVDKDYKAKIEPIQKTLKPYEAERKSINSRAQEIESQLTAGFYAMIKDGTLTSDGLTSNAGSKLSLVGKDYVTIVDADKIPDKYLRPREECIDLNAVAAAIAEGKRVAGVKIETNYTFRAVVPEVIEE